MSEPFCKHAIGAWMPDTAALTGWTSRVTCALAHLADAWSIADPGNARAAVAAIAVMIQRSSSPTQIERWRNFIQWCAGGPLTDGGRGTELLAAVDLEIIEMHEREMEE